MHKVLGHLSDIIVRRHNILTAVIVLSGIMLHFAESQFWSNLSLILEPLQWKKVTGAEEFASALSALLKNMLSKQESAIESADDENEDDAISDIPSVNW